MKQKKLEKLIQSNFELGFNSKTKKMSIYSHLLAEKIIEYFEEWKWSKTKDYDILWSKKCKASFYKEINEIDWGEYPEFDYDEKNEKQEECYRDIYVQGYYRAWEDAFTHFLDGHPMI